MNAKRIVSIFAVRVLLFVLAPQMAMAANEAKQSVTPADVLSTVKQISANLSVIQQALGEAPGSPPIFRVKDAQPAEVYSQARNLEQLAFSLAFDKTNWFRSPGPMMRGDIRPAEVKARFENSLQAILAVIDELSLEPAAIPSPAPEGTTPSDVFNAAVAASNQINQLMKRGTQPGDVYQALSTATVIGANLLYASQRGSRPPAPPEREAGKSSAEVFAKLQTLFELTKKLAARYGLQTLSLFIDSRQLEQATPNDVRDLAFLLVEELHIIHANAPGTTELGQIYAPGEKKPADVYQKAQQLQAVLNMLLEA